MLDLQALHGEFNRGGNGVAGVGRLEGRNQIGDISYDKYLAWRGIENGLRRRPRIAAGNDHGVWILPLLGERLVAGALAGVSLVPERTKSGKERFREARHRQL